MGRVTPKGEPTGKRRTGITSSAVVFFVLLVLGTLGTLWTINRLTESAVSRDFSREVDRITTLISDSILDISHVDSGFRVLYEGSQEVTHSEYSEAAAILEKEIAIAGKTGVAFLQYVKAQDRANYEDTVKKETTSDHPEYANFTIKPAGDRAEYLVVTYVEPHNEKNIPALGYDVLSEPKRRAAVEKARDTGLTTATSLVDIVQAGEPKGFIVYTPVYANDMAQSTVEQRRAAFRGVLSIVFQLDEFMSKVIDDLYVDPGVDIEIYEGSVNQDNLIFDSDEVPGVVDISSKHVSEVPIKFIDRTWMVRVSANASFGQLGAVQWLPVSVIAGGLLLSFFVALAVNNLAINRRRAEQIARSKMQELASSEQNFEEILEALPDPVAIVDKKGIILRINRAAEQVAGFTRQELVGKFFPRVGIIAPGSVPIVLKNFTTILRGKVHPPYEAVFKHKNGTHITFELNARPLYAGKKISAVQVVFRDVTKRRVLQNQLESQRAELERINKFMVGRELKMSEMKKEIDELRKLRGEDSDRGDSTR